MGFTHHLLPVVNFDPWKSSWYLRYDISPILLQFPDIFPRCSQYFPQMFSRILSPNVPNMISRRVYPISSFLSTGQFWSYRSKVWIWVSSRIKGVDLPPGGSGFSKSPPLSDNFWRPRRWISDFMDGLGAQNPEAAYQEYLPDSLVIPDSPEKHWQVILFCWKYVQSISCPALDVAHSKMVASKLKWLAKK